MVSNTGTKWSSAKQRWSTGGIQIIRLLLPGCISQRNLTRGLQPHQAAASTVVAATLLSLPFGMLSPVVQCNDSEQNPLHTTQRTPRSPQPGARGGERLSRSLRAAREAVGHQTPLQAVPFPASARERMAWRKEEFVSKFLGAGRKAQALGCSTLSSTEPRYGPEGKPGQRGQQRRAGGRSPLSAMPRPRKATLSPQNFTFAASVPRATAKPLPRCKASSPGVHGAASLGGGRSTTSLITPLLPPPCSSRSPCQKRGPAASRSAAGRRGWTSCQT